MDMILEYNKNKIQNGRSQMKELYHFYMKKNKEISSFNDKKIFEFFYKIINKF